MSKYTTEVRYICEKAAGLTESQGYTSIREIIQKAIPGVFSFDFPIFDESYRNVLCTKILKHYYTREICEETIGLWKFRLDTRLNEIMPFYNKLYKSELLEFNPLYDTEITRTGNKDNNSKSTENASGTNTNAGSNTEDRTVDTTKSGTNNQTTTGTNKIETSGTNNGTAETGHDITVTENNTIDNTGSNTTETNNEHVSNKTEKDLYSDTPQGALTNVDNETYLTNARKKIGDETTTDSGSSTGTSTSKNTETKTRNDKGTEKNKTDVTTTEKTDGSTSGTVIGNTTDTAKEVGSNSGTFSNNGSFTNDKNNSTNSTEEYLEKVIGKQGGGSYSKMLIEYRDTFINIDMQIINNLSDLFMNVW